MRNFLALECATDVCSVALAKDGLITQLVSQEPRSNARVLLPMIDELLAKAKLRFKDINALNVTLGPGSFTGIRIGISVIQGLAFAGQVPVYTWNTLEVIAAGWFLDRRQFDKTAVVAIDARMDEVYWASYRWDATQQQLCEVQAPAIIRAEDFGRLQTDTWDSDTSVALGSGFDVARFAFSADVEPCMPQARTMLELLIARGKRKPVAKTAAELVPMYLRNEVTWKKRTRIR